MGLRSGRVLPRVQYIRVIERWKQVLSEVPSVANGLAQIFDFTDALDGALPTTKRPNDQELSAALTKAEAFPTEALVPGGLKFGGKMLVAHLLGGICYPSRVMLAHRMTPIRFWEKVRSWMNRLSWLFSFGTVKLLFVDLPVRVSRVRMVRPFLAGPQGRLVSEYLSELVDRRQGMSKQTYLHRVIVDMALMAALISRYARAAASAEGLSEVEARHVREGIGVAELLFSHQGDSGQSAVLQQLRLTLMSNRDDFRRLLAAEV
jgi:lysine-N-methylase